MTAIGGQRDDFSVTTSRGILRARRVVLAIGRRGTPRPLGVPGQDLAKVTYRLVDPGQYQGKRVLVVGGGDSALEAAIMLAEQSTGGGRHRVPPARVRTLPAAQQAEARRARRPGPGARLDVDRGRGGGAGGRRRRDGAGSEGGAAERLRDRLPRRRAADRVPEDRSASASIATGATGRWPIRRWGAPARASATSASAR